MQSTFIVVLFVLGTTLFYLMVLLFGRSDSKNAFYPSPLGVSPLARGMALAADWLCAATFLGVFGYLASSSDEIYWMMAGWLLGLVLLSYLVAPRVYLSGQSCLIGYLVSRFPSSLLRYTLLLLSLFVAVVLLSLQVKGMGYIFARHLQVSLITGVAIAALLLFFFTALSGLRAITRVQMLKLCILLGALMLSAVYIFDSQVDELDWLFWQLLIQELLLSQEAAVQYLKSPATGWLAYVCKLLLIASGVAMLPYMLKRFLSAKTAHEINHSAIWMLIAIGLVYGLLDWVASKTEPRLVQILDERVAMEDAYSRMPNWLYLWEYTGVAKEALAQELDTDLRQQGMSSASYASAPFSLPEDVALLIMPELFEMPNWVIAVVTVAVMAALLSTASMLLIAAIHSCVLQSGWHNSRHERLANTSLSLVLLVFAFLIAMNQEAGVMAWFNTVVLLLAATFFPAFLLSLGNNKIPGFAVATGVWVGILGTLGYYLGVPYSDLLAIFGWDSVESSAIWVTAIWMLLNVLTVLMVTGWWQWRKQTDG